MRSTCLALITDSAEGPLSEANASLPDPPPPPTSTTSASLSTSSFVARPVSAEAALKIVASLLNAVEVWSLFFGVFCFRGVDQSGGQGTLEMTLSSLLCRLLGELLSFVKASYS